MRLPAAVAIAVAASAAGCLSQPYANQAQFGLSGGATSAAAAGATPHAGLMRVRGVSIAPPYSQPEFSYSYADGRMRTDPYAALISDPAVLVGVCAIDRLGRERLFDTVVGPSMSDLPAYELQISVLQFGANFAAASPGGAGTVVLRGFAYLTDATVQPPKLLGTFAITTEIPLAGDNATEVARGMDSALAAWLGELASRLRAATVPPLGAPPPAPASQPTPAMPVDTLHTPQRK